MTFASPVIENPITKYIEFKSSLGVFQYYDKETKTNIAIDGKFEFLVLDEFTTIAGYHKASDSGIYSNDVKNTQKEMLKVCSWKGGDIAEGYWKNIVDKVTGKTLAEGIKDKVNAAGGKYAKSLYIIYNGELCHLKLVASSASGYEDKKGITHGGWFLVKWDTGKHKVVFQETVEGKNGTNTYLVPVFAQGEPRTAQEFNICVEKYSALNEYKKLKTETEEAYTADEESPEEDREMLDDMDTEPEMSDVEKAALEMFGDSNAKPSNTDVLSKLSAI
jgi:hypothetical protein